MNPQKLGALSQHLAFNTAVSFTTNTNWQSYGGESTMSYLSQMVALAIHNFFPLPSASPSRARWCAASRGTRPRPSAISGWIVTRITYYLLLPICLVLALFFVSQGMIQNFKPYTTAKLIESQTISVQKTDANGKPVVDAKGNPVMVNQTLDTQTIVQGPMASQMAIKMLGTNGGGYTNANAAHPFENPTPLSNFLQMLALLCIGSAMTYHLGRETKNQKHGWTVWSAMFAMFLAGVLRLLVGGGARQSDSSAARRRRCRWQHGGQGSPLRHF